MAAADIATPPPSPHGRQTVTLLPVAALLSGAAVGSFAFLLPYRKHFIDSPSPDQILDPSVSRRLPLKLASNRAVHSAGVDASLQGRFLRVLEHGGAAHALRRRADHSALERALPLGHHPQKVSPSAFVEVQEHLCLFQ